MKNKPKSDKHYSSAAILGLVSSLGFISSLELSSSLAFAKNLSFSSDQNKSFRDVNNYIRNLYLVLLITLCSFGGQTARANAQTQTSPQNIILTPNQTLEFNISSSESIHIKGKNIIQAEEDKSKLTIVARHAGHAQLTIGERQINITVLTQNKNIFLKNLKDKIKTFMGLNVQLENGTIIIAGNLYRLSDWQEIYNLANEYHSNYIMKVKLDGDILNSTKTWVVNIFSQNNISLPSIQWVPTVHAYLAENLQNPELSNLLGRLGIEIIYEKSQVKLEKLVRVKIVVAEVNKKVQTQLGVTWPDNLTSQVVPKFIGPTNLEVFLKAMEQNGLGQILASPNLLARSGSEAEFLAGGEFGIKILTPRVHEVIWKKHGIFLKIKPLADRFGNMSIELSTEISLIDPSQTVDGIPGLKTNRISTHIDLSQTRTIVLSGLIRNDWGRSSNGIIGLSNIPIIGKLFGSEDYFNNKTELVIFVTPEIVNESSLDLANSNIKQD
jgi:pilus assembly protein CpaC